MVPPPAVDIHLAIFSPFFIAFDRDGPTLSTQHSVLVG